MRSAVASEKRARQMICQLHWWQYAANIRDEATMAIIMSNISFSVNNISFKYKVHRYTTDTSYIQYNTFEMDTDISLRHV